MSPPLALVVDDLPTIRCLLRRILESAGWLVHEADCGPEALAMVQAQVYDAMLLDISMPQMSGIAVCKAIRRGAAPPPRRIIACTAHAFAGYRETLLGSGFDDVLTKPFSRKALELALATVCNRA